MKLGNKLFIYAPFNWLLYYFQLTFIFVLCFEMGWTSIVLVDHLGGNKIVTPEMGIIIYI